MTRLFLDTLGHIRYTERGRVGENWEGRWFVGAGHWTFG